MDERQTADGSEQTIIIEEKITKVNGEVAIKKYQRGKFLGKGGFAKCYEATNLETKKILAAKIIAKSSLTKNRARQKLISEIKIHKSLQQVNIVQFEHVFEDHENVYILLELCSNQTLNELIKRRKRLTEIEVQCYVAQIVSALKYLHTTQVIHRDLKLGNLFLNKNMELKLGDFGLATKLEFDGEKKRTICGTPNYIAPEVLDGKVGHSFEVDIWSLGVIIYAMLIGKPPFETPDVKTTYKKIRMNSYNFPEHVPVSDAAKNIITKILNLEPSKRPSLDEIMAHPFMNNGGMIPKVLPLSTLACPPSASYNKQFQPQNNTSSMKVSIQAMPQRLTETTPINQPKPNTNNRNNNGSSDRFPLQKPSSSGNILDDQFASSNLNQGGQNTGFNPPNRPHSQKPNDIRTSQSQKTLNNPFGSGLNGANSVNNLQMQKTFNKSEIYVKKWVDYSSKYGLGYLLSNGATGVFFNDSTKIVLDPKSQQFEYMERRGTERQDVVDSHHLNDYPKELQKKVTLLQHFRSYLEGEANKQTEIYEADDGKNIVYVKKWMKTRHAIMFRLSNKIVQVNFTDKTEIILSSEHKMVTYVNKQGERSNYPLATALDSHNTEMAKRLKYTKEILTHMLQGGHNQELNRNQMTGTNWQNPM
ncbi:Serine/threonine-protein kinase plk1 [Paramecium bursaria]